MFIFLALGFFLGEILDVPGSGFAIVALLYVAIIWIITKNEAKIRTKILNLVIAALAAKTTNKTQKTMNHPQQTPLTNNVSSKHVWNKRIKKQDVYLYPRKRRIVVALRIVIVIIPC